MANLISHWGKCILKPQMGNHPLPSTISPEWLSVKQQTTASAVKGMENQEPLHIAAGKVTWHSHLGNPSGSSLKR